ncbi:40S ribosomal protein S5-1 [Hordeum vulgare]|nr:40S ribosomal protein S5-1 [Hordeum vulgare]
MESARERFVRALSGPTQHGVVGRMAEPNGRVYTRLDMAFDKNHRLRALENGEGRTDNRTNDIPFVWLEANRSGWTADANPETVEQYARAITNWGSAGLAYLYRHLDDACRKTTERSCMGRCIWGLSIWMWERLPVGCPKIDPRKPNPCVGLVDEDPILLEVPTLAFSWNKVKMFGSKQKSLYKSFINEIDNLTYREISLKPFKTVAEDEYNLMVRSTQGARTEYASMTQRLTRELNKSIIEGSNALMQPEPALRDTMKRFITRCPKIVTMLGCAPPANIDVHAPGTSMQASGAATCSSRAGGSSTHIDKSDQEEEDSHDEGTGEMNISQMSDAPPISEISLKPFKTTAEDEYDVMVRSTQGARREYASMTDRVIREHNKSIIEGSNALMQPEPTLRDTMKRFITRCPKIVTMLGCTLPANIDVHAPRTSVHASGAAASSSCADGSSTHIDKSDQEEEDSHDEGAEEMNISQMSDAPPLSQAKRASHPHWDVFFADLFQKEVINPYLTEVLKHPQSIKMSEGMLHIRDVEGPKKTGSMETRLEAMEQQVFKCQGMLERGLNANHTMITEFTSNHKMDAIDIGKHLSRLYDRVDQLQGQIYDLQNQNCARATQFVSPKPSRAIVSCHFAKGSGL